MKFKDKELELTREIYNLRKEGQEWGFIKLQKGLSKKEAQGLYERYENHLKADIDIPREEKLINDEENEEEEENENEDDEELNENNQKIDMSAQGFNADIENKIKEKKEYEMSLESKPRNSPKKSNPKKIVARNQDRMKNQEEEKDTDQEDNVGNGDEKLGIISPDLKRKEMELEILNKRIELEKIEVEKEKIGLERLKYSKEKNKEREKDFEDFSKIVNEKLGLKDTEKNIKQKDIDNSFDCQDIQEMKQTASDMKQSTINVSSPESKKEKKKEVDIYLTIPIQKMKKSDTIISSSSSETQSQEKNSFNTYHSPDTHIQKDKPRLSLISEKKKDQEKKTIQKAKSFPLFTHDVSISPDPSEKRKSMFGRIMQVKAVRITFLLLSCFIVMLILGYIALFVFTQKFFAWTTLVFIPIFWFAIWRYMHYNPQYESSSPMCMDSVIIQKDNEVQLNEDNMVDMSKCPQCNGKLIKGKVIQEGDKVRQLIKCRNNNCDFQKNLEFNIK